MTAPQVGSTERRAFYAEVEQAQWVWRASPRHRALVDGSPTGARSPLSPAVEYASSSTSGFGGLFTLGYQFTMSVPFTVDALAYFDDGLGETHGVQLWNSVGGNVVQTSVVFSDPVQGHFQYTSFTPIPLPPGNYTIGGEYFGNFRLIPFNAAGVVTVPGFTWTQGVYASGAGLNYPTSPHVGFGQNEFLIPNFSIVPAAPVPESSTLILPRLWPCWHPRLRLATKAGSSGQEELDGTIAFAEWQLVRIPTVS